MQGAPGPECHNDHAAQDVRQHHSYDIFVIPQGLGQKFCIYAGYLLRPWVGVFRYVAETFRHVLAHWHVMRRLRGFTRL